MDETSFYKFYIVVIIQLYRTGKNKNIIFEKVDEITAISFYNITQSRFLKL